MGREWRVDPNPASWDLGAPRLSMHNMRLVRKPSSFLKTCICIPDFVRTNHLMPSSGKWSRVSTTWRPPHKAAPCALVSGGSRCGVSYWLQCSPCGSHCYPPMPPSPNSKPSGFDGLGEGTWGCSCFQWYMEPALPKRLYNPVAPASWLPQPCRLIILCSKWVTTCLFTV